MSKPLVYFAGAIRGDRVMAGMIKEVILYIKQHGIQVLSEHVGAEFPAQVFAEKIGKFFAELTPRDIEQQDIAWLDQATHVIAEFTGASTGTGREIEYARTKGNFGKTPAKILCVYHKAKENSVSAMITGMDRGRYPDVVVQSYGNIDELKNLISKFLGI